MSNGLKRSNIFKEIEYKARKRHCKIYDFENNVAEHHLNDALDENFALDKRLDAASRTWQLIISFDEGYLVVMLERKTSLFIKLGQAVLFTGYLPLQLLFFMILAGIVTKIKDDPIGAIVVGRLKEKMGATPLIQTIPWKHSINWKDPALCREKLQWINLHTKSSTSVKIKKCWISVSSIENLQETIVQPVLDFGSTIATIYRTASTGHTIVINIPYSCIHSIKFTEDTGMLNIQTNEVTGLKEVSLLAFLISRKHYTTLRRALQDKFGETVQKHEVVQKKGITKFDDVKFQKKDKIVSEITASPKSFVYQRSTPTEIFRQMDQGLRNADSNCIKLKIDQTSSQANLESQVAGFEDAIHKMSQILFARKKQVQVSQYTLTSQRDSIRNCLLFDLPQADVAISILHDDIKKRSEHISKWALDAMCDAYMNGTLQTSTYRHGLLPVLVLVLAVVPISISFVRQF